MRNFVCQNRTPPKRNEFIRFFSRLIIHNVRWILTNFQNYFCCFRLLSVNVPRKSQSFESTPAAVSFPRDVKCQLKLICSQSVHVSFLRTITSASVLISFWHMLLMFLLRTRRIHLRLHNHTHFRFLNTLKVVRKKLRAALFIICTILLYSLKMCLLRFLIELRHEKFLVCY